MLFRKVDALFGELLQGFLNFEAMSRGAYKDRSLSTRKAQGEAGRAARRWTWEPERRR